MSTADTLRIYGSLRTAHLERFREMTPATVLFRKQRYDYDESVLGTLPPPVRMSRVGTVRHLLTHTYRYIELNEPFVATRWLDLFTQVVAIRLRGLVTGTRARIAAYCIGYSDPAAELRDRRRRLPAGIATALTRVAVGVLARSTDRLAFGTSGARAVYGTYVPESVLAPRARMFEALPAVCGCPEPDVAETRAGRCVFVGSFQERKGIRQLMAAWDLVRAGDGDLTLHLIGKGPLLAEVQAWAAERPEVRLDVDPPRPSIHAALRRASVLVLLSQRVGAWREQIGLPIVEGLAHGTTVVTTTETGLAEWLAAHGHTVLPADADGARIASALTAAARAPKAPDAVLADLPEVDQRAAADAWMLRPDEHIAAG